jgi:hypothetical protein
MIWQLELPDHDHWWTIPDAGAVDCETRRVDLDQAFAH